MPTELPHLKPLPAAPGASDAAFARTVSRGRLLRHDEVAALSRRIQAGDREALRRLVEANLRLVLSQARRHADRGLPFGDLVQEGTLALLRAAELYDARRDVHFATYATIWIQRAMTEAIRRQGSSISASVKDGRRIAKLRRLQGTERTGGERDAELAAALGVPEARLGALRAAAAPVASLDAVTDESADPLLERVADARAVAPVDTVLRHESAAAVSRAVDGLPDREREVVRRRFALGGGEPETLASIGRGLGLSAERVRQLEQAALRELAEDANLRTYAAAA